MKNQNIYRHSYARNIVTYLSEKKEINIYDFTSTAKLINEIVLYKIDREKEKDNIKNYIYDFAYILFYLNDLKDEYTNWTGLVCIEIDSGREFTKEDLANLIYKDWLKYEENKYTHKREVLVRATEAGGLYAMFTPDFEYYSCRYMKKYKPLLAIDNNDTLSDLLNSVYNTACKYINKIFKTEREMEDCRYCDNHSVPLLHVSRIINHHIGYLRNFIYFLKSEVCLIKEKEKNKMINTTIDIIENYLNFAYKKNIAISKIIKFDNIKYTEEKVQ